MYVSPVTPFIVVPRDNLDKVAIKSNSSLSIKNARPAPKKGMKSELTFSREVKCLGTK